MASVCIIPSSSVRTGPHPFGLCSYLYYWCIGWKEQVSSLVSFCLASASSVSEGIAYSKVWPICLNEHLWMIFFQIWLSGSVILCNSSWFISFQLSHPSINCWEVRYLSLNYRDDCQQTMTNSSRTVWGKIALYNLSMNTQSWGTWQPAAALCDISVHIMMVVRHRLPPTDDEWRPSRRGED